MSQAALTPGGKRLRLISTCTRVCGVRLLLRALFPPRSTKPLRRCSSWAPLLMCMHTCLHFGCAVPCVCAASLQHFTTATAPFQVVRRHEQLEAIRREMRQKEAAEHAYKGEDGVDGVLSEGEEDDDTKIREEEATGGWVQGVQGGIVAGWVVHLCRKPG